MNDNEMSETDLPQAQQPAKKKRVISLAKLAVILDGAAIVAVGLTYLCSNTDSSVFYADLSIRDRGTRYRYYGTVFTP